MRERITEPSFKINNFDILRLLAATEVLLQHVYFHLKVLEPNWIQFIKNFPGVPIFFVISGYLISASYERSKNLGEYFTNRFLRIFPALWSCIFLTVISVSIFGHISFFRWDAVSWFFLQCAGVIYTPSFMADYGFGSYNGALWTIPIELQFYILMPVVYILIKKNGNGKSAILFLLIFFIALAFVYKREFSSSEYVGPGQFKMAKIVLYTFIPHYYMFLCGMLLQKLRIYQNRFIYQKGIFWLLLYLAANYLMPEFALKEIFVRLILAVTVISLAYTIPGISKRILHGNDISYGIYIYHGLFVNIFVEYEMYGKVVYVFWVFTCTYLVAFSSWRVIEKPMLRKKRHSINPN